MAEVNTNKELNKETKTLQEEPIEIKGETIKIFTKVEKKIEANIAREIKPEIKEELQKHLQGEINNHQYCNMCNLVGSDKYEYEEDKLAYNRIENECIQMIIENEDKYLV